MLHDLLLLAISKSGLDQALQASRAGPQACLLVATRGARGRTRPIRSQELLGRRKRCNGRSADRKSPASACRIDASSSTTDMSSAWGLMGNTVSGPQRFA